MINITELKKLCDNIVKSKDKVTTEEATKTSMILPFIKYLGYDIFNPKEFIPEYVADFGVKKGEKVDYAIKINNKVVIIIEAKVCGKRLDADVSQLFRYYSVTEAKFAILTNGVEYRFYTDSEQKNIMDRTPFHVTYVDSLTARDIDILTVLSKDDFDYKEAYRIASSAKLYNFIFDNITDIVNCKKLVQLIGNSIGIKKVNEEIENIIGKAISDSIFGEGDTISGKLANNMNEIYGGIETYSECSKPNIKSIENEKRQEKEKGNYTLTDEEKSIIAVIKAITNKDIVAYPTKFNTRLSIVNGKQTIMILYRNGAGKSVWSFAINGYSGPETKGSRNSIKFTGDNSIFSHYKKEICKAVVDSLR